MRGTTTRALALLAAAAAALATGFATGDVRGAIAVRVPIPPRP
jgi:hypothetical protein